MKCTLKTVQNLPTYRNSRTFGEILKSASKTKPKNVQSKPPAGYELLKSQFPNEIDEFGKYLTTQLKNGSISKIQTRDEISRVFDTFTNGINDNMLKINKTLTPAQRKMLLAAYAKAGKKLNSDIKTTDKLNKTKLNLVIKRNWNILEYIAKSNGIDINENKNNESWGFEDELVDDITKSETKKIATEETKTKPLLTDNIKSDFNSFLKNLNKVHQTKATNVLPKMTTFKPQPSIKSLKVNIPEHEVKDFENFLNNAKKSSDNMDEDLFKAKNNYEISKNITSKYHRSFENLNFFTPVCIPGTLLDTEKFGIELTLQFQNNFKNQLDLNNIESFQILKIYVDGQSSILNNENRTYWNGSISNIYKIMTNLKDPVHFKSRFQIALKNGWIPVNSEEREILMVRDPKQHRKLYIKRIIIIGGLSTILAFGMFGASTIF